jgi:hypothetical protein
LTLRLDAFDTTRQHHEQASRTPHQPDDRRAGWE